MDRYTGKKKASLFIAVRELLLGNLLRCQLCLMAASRKLRLVFMIVARLKTFVSQYFGCIQQK